MVPEPAHTSTAREKRRGGHEPGSVDWFRFWMQMLVAVVVFNVLAGLLTWFFILPRLHFTLM